MPAVLMRGETHALERIALPLRRLDPRGDCLGTRRLGHADDRTARAVDLQPANFSRLGLGAIARETQMHADGAPASTRRRGAGDNANGLRLSAGVAIKARGAFQIAGFGACSSGSSWFA